MNELVPDTDLPVVAGVELGGTKAIAVVGQGRTIFDEIRVPTTTPAERLGALASGLAVWSTRWQPLALGVASFGPVALHAGQSGYGHMLSTPKRGSG